MLAVRREPRKGNLTPLTCLTRVNFPYILGVVLSCRVVSCVHGNRRRIVIDSNVNLYASRLIYPKACTAATGEAIYNQLVPVHLTPPIVHN